MTTPEEFYNNFVDSLDAKPSRGIMTLCLTMLRDYRNILAEEFEYEKISKLSHDRLLEEYGTPRIHMLDAQIELNQMELQDLPNDDNDPFVLGKKMENRKMREEMTKLILKGIEKKHNETPED